jgi:DNA 3'-phosphatase
MQAPGINELIAEKLIEMSEEKDKSKFQKGAYITAANNIRAFPQAITSGQFARQNIKGVGASIMAKIDEILRTGTLQVLEQRPPEEKAKKLILREFRKLYAVGKVTAEQWYGWGYRTIEQLAELHPMMTDAQKLGYQYYKDFELKISREEINYVNTFIHNILDPLQINFVIAGSYRRCLKESSDIDILLENNGNLAMPNILDPLVRSGLIIGNLAIGETVYRGIIRIAQNYPARRLDIRLVDSKAWPFALLYFTGSKDFNVQIRNRAISLGLSLSEYSLTDQNANSYPAKSEQEIFQLLGVQWLEPKDRTGTSVLTLIDPTIKIIPAIEQNETYQQTGRWFKGTADFYIYISDSIFLTPDVLFFPTINKIAAFDLDNTLITTRNGGFRKSADDLILMPNVIPVLKHFIATGYTIAIFTNQLSKSEDQKLLNYNRVINAVNLINLPMMVFMSTANDQYRKPNTGMWFELLRFAPSINNGFFVGDALGRPGDHSDSDLKFAQAIGMQSYSPEQIFNRQ